MTSVSDWYAHKTSRILEKYGPGPRVHYHTGCFSGPPPAAPTTDELRAAMVAAQEDLLRRVTARWPNAVAGDVLDAGCGLGGTALWLLTEGPAEHVTGVTNCTAHGPLILGFAQEAGVLDRLDVLVGDATELPTDRVFDAAVSVEASCYFDRDAWFAQLSRSLRPGGHVVIIDCFRDDPAVAPGFDAYWRTHIGSFVEYEWAARRHGFSLADQLMLNEACTGFWRLSLAFIERQLQEADGGERLRLRRSVKEHRQLLDGFCGGGIGYRAVLFKREAHVRAAAA